MQDFPSSGQGLAVVVVVVEVCWPEMMMTRKEMMMLRSIMLWYRGVGAVQTGHNTHSSARLQVQSNIQHSFYLQFPIPLSVLSPGWRTSVRPIQDQEV